MVLRQSIFFSGEKGVRQGARLRQQGVVIRVAPVARAACNGARQHRGVSWAERHEAGQLGGVAESVAWHRGGTMSKRRNGAVVEAAAHQRPAGAEQSRLEEAARPAQEGGSVLKADRRGVRTLGGSVADRTGSCRCVNGSGRVCGDRSTRWLAAGGG